MDYEKYSDVCKLNEIRRKCKKNWIKNKNNIKYLFYTETSLDNDINYGKLKGKSSEYSDYLIKYYSDMFITNCDDIEWSFDYDFDMSINILK